VGSAALRGADSPGPDAPASASQMSSKVKQLLKSVKWSATKSYTRAKLPGMGGIDHESTSGHRERKLEENAVIMQVRSRSRFGVGWLDGRRLGSGFGAGHII
jgi:hypothetical protein